MALGLTSLRRGYMSHPSQTRTAPFISPRVWGAMFALPLLAIVIGALWFNGQSWQLDCRYPDCELKRTVWGMSSSVVSFTLLSVEERRGRLHLSTSSGHISLPGGYTTKLNAMRDYIERKQSQYSQGYAFKQDPVFWLLVGVPMLLFGYLGVRVLFGGRRAKPGSAVHKTDRVLSAIFDIFGIMLGLIMGVMFVCLGTYMLGLTLMRSGSYALEDVFLVLLLGVLPIIGGIWFLYGTLRYAHGLLNRPVEEPQLKRVRRRKRSAD